MIIDAREGGAALTCDAKVVRDVSYDSSIGRSGIGDLYLPHDRTMIGAVYAKTQMRKNEPSR